MSATAAVVTVAVRITWTAHSPHGHQPDNNEVVKIHYEYLDLTDFARAK